MFVAVAAAATSLVGCSSDSDAVPTLNLYIYPDNSGAVQQAVDNCTAQPAAARYKIKYQKLPNGADGQRQQMVRRLAAEDSSMDILGLDVTWAPEFAEAGWIREWTGRQQGAGGGGHPRRAPRHRDATRTSSGRRRSTATPSCCGTGPTSCRRRRRRGTR